MKKNNITCDIEKVKLILYLFQSKYCPKKIIDDTYNNNNIIFEKEIDKIIMINIKSKIIRNSPININRIKNEFGFNPKINILKYLEILVQEYKQTLK